jgi:hypothetical protein
MDKQDNFIIIKESNLLDLARKLITHFEKLQGKEYKKVWLDTIETKSLLSIKSDTTLFNLRSQGLIEYSQPSRKVILYKRDSILAYLEKHSHKTF